MKTKKALANASDAGGAPAELWLEIEQPNGTAAPEAGSAAGWIVKLSETSQIQLGYSCGQYKPDAQASGYVEPLTRLRFVLVLVNSTSGNALAFVWFG